MHSSQFGITFTDSRGPVNSDGPIHCIRSLNRMVRYSVMPVCELRSSVHLKLRDNRSSRQGCNLKSSPSHHQHYYVNSVPTPPSNVVVSSSFTVIHIRPSIHYLILRATRISNFILLVIIGSLKIQEHNLNEKSIEKCPSFGIM